jgi:uncharacterized membrane protein
MPPFADPVHDQGAVQVSAGAERQEAFHGPGSRLCADGVRSVAAMAPAAAVTLLLAALLLFTGPPGEDWPATVVVLCLVCWTVFTVLYVGMTERTFNGIDADEFARRMAARTALRSRHWRALHTKAGPTFAVCASAVAFAVVLVLPHVEGVKVDDWLLIPLSASILFSCWAVSVLSYALHYAEYDLGESSLDFPGRRTNAFADYLYFALAVATTFGATDVTITTPEMRRVVNLHTVLTFAYNSVIVALLVAILIR